MLYMACAKAKIGPDQLLFKFPDHPFKLLDIRFVDLPVITGLKNRDNAVNLLIEFFSTLQTIKSDHIPDHPVCQSPAAPILLTGGNHKQVVIDILIPLVLISFLKKVRIADHSDISFFEKLFSILQSFNNKIVGYGCKTGS